MRCRSPLVLVFLAPMAGCLVDYELSGKEETPLTVPLEEEPQPDEVEEPPPAEEPEEPAEEEPPVLPGPGVPPVAKCKVAPTTVAPPHEDADWLDDGSYDPNGGPLTYEWSLAAKPPGSSAPMPAGAADRLGYAPDLVGIYIGELIVRNQDGLASDPCFAELAAVSSENLRIEMFWSVERDDMDLHLIRDPGPTVTDNDCYYLNCQGRGPDWGIANDDRDDPTLDLDDIQGTGPENINIERPTDSIFHVMVHDYPGMKFDGTNEVTVNIYLDGVLEWSETKPVVGDDSETWFATINWAQGTVTSLNGSPLP